MSADPLQLGGTRFVEWLEQQVIADARGDKLTTLPIKPADLLWIGRLAPENAAWKVALGERGQRLDPCSCGFRFRPAAEPPWEWHAEVRFRIWQRVRDPETKEVHWEKSDQFATAVTVRIASDPPGTHSFGADEFAALLGELSAIYKPRIDVDIGRESGETSVAVVVVNDSIEKKAVDSNLYEVSIELAVGAVTPFVLDSLPDSFRYDRRVPAYGINGGVELNGGVLRTVDVASQDRRRPEYWDETIGTQPDLRFSKLAADPLPPLRELVDALRRWSEREWSRARIDERQREHAWTAEMRAEADREAGRFGDEVRRCQEGLDLLARDANALAAFRLANEAFIHSGAGRYDSWRPFQLGFLLAALPSLIDADGDERRIVDTLWFATGGGKTETYLAVVVFTCFYDRLRGKTHGISCWSRFPLRMLSLQQTQRFADALAGAELARRRSGIGGESFALGFLVGRGGTPNRVRDDAGLDDANATDADMPRRNRVLLRCPFCRDPNLEMRFDRRHWLLLHCCTNADCPWQDEGLPFYVVDEEIYRLLPSVIVGTLDKAASVSMQAAMRGLYAAPLGACKGPRHGFTYAPRSSTAGCLVPECKYGPAPLPQAKELFPPTVRIQDELHLLRGGLGAIDAHYETLFDHLQQASGSPTPKNIASSATLAGYAGQVAALYHRDGTVFPLPGPAEGVSFWTNDQPLLARRFIGLAPRGVTLEFANDRLAESLQRAIRRLRADPAGVCAEIGIDPELADFLIDMYGTHVVYGNTVRDVEAAARSFETQPGVTPLNVAKLTGGTLLEEVSDVLKRLDAPEENFDERLHIICASSMMSHGVDIDRFNVISILGVPLTTAEFIQTTARIGRRFPGLVLVLHRMGVERDASVFRTFDIFIRQGDRFIEPIAITRKSRRVLRHTFPGVFLARVLGVHEASAVSGGGKQLTTVKELRRYLQERPITEDDEFSALCDALALDPKDQDDPLVVELRRQLRETWRELNDPATRARWPGEVTPRPAMRSLREVEMQVPIRTLDSNHRPRHRR
jgi:hypothetical protein